MNPVIRKLSHPAFLLLIIAACILLWMPFGMGYYGWPWEDKIGEIGIQVIAFAFLFIAAIALFGSLRPNVRTLRLILSVVALLVSLWGLLALYHWKNRYRGPLPPSDRPVEEMPNQ